MEPVLKKVKSDVSLLDFHSAGEMFKFSLDFVSKNCESQYKTVVAKLKSRVGSNFNQEDFTLEYVWAVSVSGFSAKVVTQKLWPLMKAHGIYDNKGSFIPAEHTEEDGLFYRTGVFDVWKNKAKATAIHSVRRLIRKNSWPVFKEKYLQSMDSLRKLPFMGPALSCHVWRNLGNLYFVKPDVHLMRLAKGYHMESPQHLCTSLALDFNLLPAEVDLTIWYASAMMTRATVN